MINEELMKKSSGKHTKIILNSGEILKIYVEEYVRKEDDDEEAMIFYDKRFVIPQSEIKSIEILD